MKPNDPHDLTSLEAKLKATQKELADSILQRDLAIRLLRRQTLTNAQLQRQIMISLHLSIANLLWKNYQILYHRLRRVTPEPLKQLIKRHLLGIRS